MKTKEQLAEDHVNKRYPEAEWTTYQRNFAEQDFKAGYDARDAQLGKLPEFDEKVIFELSLEDDLARFRGKFPDENIELTAKIVAASKAQGARKYHEHIAKIIAAKDEKLQVTEKLLYMSDKKIRELEMQSAEVALNVLKVYAVLQKANALIDEALDVLCQCDLDKDGRALVEKIKQYKESGK